MKSCTIKLIWESGYWCAESDDELGIVLESASFDNLVERVKLAVPEMLELNLGYTGDIEINFEAHRMEILQAV